MRKLSSNEVELVDFATRHNKQMGANLHFLLRHEYVYTALYSDYMMLLNHLRTNKDYGLITGFEYNHKKCVIWLDSVSDALKEQFNCNI